jgi:hypothetical protein
MNQMFIFEIQVFCFLDQMLIFFLFLSSLFWGITNPFIKRATKKIEWGKSDSKCFLEGILRELKFLFANLNVKILQKSLLILNKF